MNLINQEALIRVKLVDYVDAAYYFTVHLVCILPVLTINLETKLQSKQILTLISS